MLYIHVIKNRDSFLVVVKNRDTGKSAKALVSGTAQEKKERVAELIDAVQPQPSV